jgi:hypothetical protein
MVRTEWRDCPRVTLRALIIELCMIIAAGIVLAAIGPYGSFEIGSFALRLSYWLPAALGGYAIVRPFVLMAERAHRRLNLPMPLALGLAVMVSAVPGSFFILWLNGNRDHLPPFEGWFQLYLQVALIGAVITLVFWLIDRSSPSRPPEAPPAPVEQAPASTRGPAADEALSAPAPFLARLPAHLRDGLIALEMEDHYVRAHCRGGSALILMRLRDAVTELAGIEGMQVHRSWWVARAAVVKAERDGRNLSLLLVQGLQVPVARTNIPALREQGWLENGASA